MTISKILSMSRRVRSRNALILTFAVAVAPAVLAQDKPAEKPAGDKPSEANVVEFGVRYRWGDVYGRPDLMLGPGGPAASGNPSIAPGCLGCGTAFDPLLSTSKYEEYRDLRNGFFVRKLDATFDNILGSRNYVRAQSQKTLYRDQSYLVTFGQYGKFKFQFRYDEIPHVYSNTTRTLLSRS